jgi:uncharacterized protein YacL
MRFRSNSKSNNSSTQARTELVLDTSAVIDGRILSLAEFGFLRGSVLIVTNIVLDELQYLADEGDSFKRARARYGFEVLSKLMKIPDIKLKNETLPASKLEVDQQLLNLSKSRKAQLFTVDFNLAQRAKIEGALVLNPADLTEALKPQILPGENFTIKLIQKGEDKNQAVGYLPDGTMVVAENLQNKVGQTVDLKSSKIIQTAGGRIVFAEAASTSSNLKSSKNPRNSKAPKSSTSSVAGAKLNPSLNSRANSKPQPKPAQNSNPSSPNSTQNNQSQNQNQSRARRPNKEDSLIAAINNTK